MKKYFYCFLTAVVYFLLISCRSLPEYREDFSVLISSDTKLLFSVKNVKANEKLISGIIENKFSASVNMNRILKRTDVISFYLDSNNRDFALLLEGNYNRFYSGSYLTVSSKWHKEKDSLEYWRNDEQAINLYGFKDRAILLSSRDIASVLNPKSPIILPEEYPVLMQNNIAVFFPDFSNLNCNNELGELNLPANSMWLLFNKNSETVYNIIIRGEFFSNKDARQSSSLVKMALKKVDENNPAGIVIEDKIRSEINGNVLELEGFYIDENSLIDLLSRFL